MHDKKADVYAKNVKKLILKNVSIIGSADTEPELIGVENADLGEVKYC